MLIHLDEALEKGEELCAAHSRSAVERLEREFEACKPLPKPQANTADDDETVATMMRLAQDVCRARSIRLSAGAERLLQTGQLHAKVRLPCFANSDSS